jgi:hypothetical protein
VDEISSNLNQVSTNDLSPLFHSLCVAYFIVWMVHALVKRSCPRVRGLSTFNTRMYAGKVTCSPRTYVIVLTTTRVHLLYLSKKLKQGDNLNFFCNRMYVHWREREHEELDVLVEEDPRAILCLSNVVCGNFFSVHS